MAETKNKTVVTLEAMKHFGSVMEAIEWARKQQGEYPKRPFLAPLKKGANSKEALNYANALAVHEKEMKQCEIAYKEHSKTASAIDGVIVDFIKDAAGLNTIPEQYRDKVYSRAYEDGHSYGFYEVYLKLNSLLEIFD